MNKTELMETYTAEQLAEMVVELQNEKENKVFKVQANKIYQKELDEFLKESPIHNSIDKICKDILEQKNNAMAMEFTKIICDLLKRYGVYVHCTETKLSEKITTNSIEEHYGIIFDSMDFSQHDKEFTDKIEELQSEAEKYRKAFEEAKKERDFQVAEYQEKIKEMTDRAILEFPTEPIDVANFLINGLGTSWHYDSFDVSELRQIAEHLLIYCKHNKEEEE